MKSAEDILAPHQNDAGEIEDLEAAILALQANLEGNAIAVGAIDPLKHMARIESYVVETFQYVIGLIFDRAEELELISNMMRRALGEEGVESFDPTPIREEHTQAQQAILFRQMLGLHQMAELVGQKQLHVVKQ